MGEGLRGRVQSGIEECLVRLWHGRGSGCGGSSADGAGASCRGGMMERGYPGTGMRSLREWDEGCGVLVRAHG